MLSEKTVQVKPEEGQPLPEYLPGQYITSARESPDNADFAAERQFIGPTRYGPLSH